MPLPPLRPPFRPLALSWALVRTLPVVAILVPTLFAGNLLQMLSVVVLPFSAKAFRALNRGIATAWWGACVLAARHLHGVRVVLHGDTLPEGENAVVMVNHQSMADITVLLDVACVNGRLGDLKWFAKNVIKYVPGIGWGLLFLDCLFIERNWTADRGLIRKVFHRITSGKVPVWILSFLEGTRLTPAKLKRSQDYAASRSLPVLEHVLLPRTKGFVASVEGLSGHVQAVYDITIGYVEAVPTLGQWIIGHVTQVNVHIRRTPVSALPAGDEALTDWVIGQYREKDRLLDRYYKTGTMA